MALFTCFVSVSKETVWTLYKGTFMDFLNLKTTNFAIIYCHYADELVNEYNLSFLMIKKMYLPHIGI